MANPLFGRLKSMFGLGGKPSPGFAHGLNDGIVHKSDNPVLPSPQTFAEQSAVAQALRRMGHRSEAVGPDQHRNTVDLHTRVAAWLAHKLPDSPVVQHYRKAADALGSPDVVQPRTSLKPPPGEWPEPDRLDHDVRGHSGPANRELTDAAVPLVRMVHTMLRNAGLTPPLPIPTKATIAPPTPEPVLDLADGSEPTPLVEHPDDRWKDMDRLVAEGKSRTDIVRHLMTKYGLHPATAAAQYRRWGRNYLHRTKKLARTPQPQYKGDITGPAVDPRIAGTRIASHLHELAEHYATSHPQVSELAKRALYSSDKRPWDKTALPDPPRPPGVTERDPDPYKALGEALKGTASTVGLKPHRLANAYNWSKVQQGLALETHMRNWLKAHVKTEHAGKFTDREIFQRAERLFDANPAVRAKFLTAAGGGTHNELHDAIRRLVDKETEREQLSERYAAPKDGDYRWHDSHRWVAQAPHAKYAGGKR